MPINITPITILIITVTQWGGSYWLTQLTDEKWRLRIVKKVLRSHPVGGQDRLTPEFKLLTWKTFREHSPGPGRKQSLRWQLSLRLMLKALFKGGALWARLNFSPIEEGTKESALGRAQVYSTCSACNSEISLQTWPSPPPPPPKASPLPRGIPKRLGNSLTDSFFRFILLSTTLSRVPVGN